MKALLFCVLFLIQAEAAVYFVDYVGGANSNNGTSSATPFKHCPGDPNATSNANRTLAAGDTVVFKGGVVYAFGAGSTDCIQVNASGTEGSPITFISGHVYSPQWGTTAAEIDGANSEVFYNSRMGVISMISRSWIVIDGLEIYNIPDREDYTGAIGWRGTGGNIIVKRCTLYNGGGNGVLIHGLFGAGTNPQNFTVDECTIHDFNAHGVFFRGGLDNVTVTNCTIYRAGIQVYSGSYAGDCIFLGRGTTGDVINGVTIANNDLGSCPIKGHIIFAADCTTNRVIGNYLHGTNNVFSIAWTRNITNSWINNNVFDCKIVSFEGIIRGFTDEGTSGGGQANDLRILNNTIYARPAAGGVIYFGRGNSSSNQLFKNIQIKNNIVIDSVSSLPLIYVQANSAGTGPIVELATFASDYNVFNSSLVSPFYWNSQAKTFAAWQSATGGDSHSQTGDVLFNDAANADYTLTYYSSAVGAGVDLSSVFTTDKDGDTRLQWDIGAYYYANGTPIISSQPSRTVPKNGELVIPFLVNDDVDSPSSLTASRATSNESLIPLANCVLGGIGTNRTVTVSPTVGQTGEATLTLGVADSQGLTNSTTIAITVTDLPFANVTGGRSLRARR